MISRSTMGKQLTGNRMLTKKGKKIMGSMKEQYGPKKGEQVFYASRNKGNIKGVERASHGGLISTGSDARDLEAVRSFNKSMEYGSSPPVTKMKAGGKVPAGYHRMPDGSIMKDSDHMKKGGKTESKVNEAGNYTKPTMRKQLFNKIKAGGKGGKPGQWSARKAQMLAQQYKAKGGGYRD